MFFLPVGTAELLVISAAHVQLNFTSITNQLLDLWSQFPLTIFWNTNKKHITDLNPITDGLLNITLEHHNTRVGISECWNPLASAVLLSPFLLWFSKQLELTGEFCPWAMEPPKSFFLTVLLFLTVYKVNCGCFDIMVI